MRIAAQHGVRRLVNTFNIFLFITVLASAAGSFIYWIRVPENRYLLLTLPIAFVGLGAAIVGFSEGGNVIDALLVRNINREGYWDGHRINYMILLAHGMTLGTFGAWALETLSKRSRDDT